MKTVWILPGGGAHCSYTAGACVALHEMGIPNPDIIIASSGSVGTAGYYLAEQFNSIKNVWTYWLANPRVSNPLRVWKILDIDYLIDVVAVDQEKMSVSKVYQSETLLLVPLASSADGHLEYFSNKDGTDFFDLMKAAKSAPFFTGIFRNRKLKYKGDVYLDVRVSSRPQMNIKKAIELGADRIIVLDNYHPKSSWTDGRFWYKIWLLFGKKKIRDLHLKYMSIKQSIPKNVDLIYIKPENPLDMATWNNNERKLEQTFYRGFKDVLNNERIKGLLS